MPHYLLAYHGGSGIPESVEKQEQFRAEWERWFTDLGGANVDPGYPVGATRTVSGDGTVTDGGGANPVGGYSIIKADSMDAAVKLARGCPVLAIGGTVEVGETLPM